VGLVGKTSKERVHQYRIEAPTLEELVTFAEAHLSADEQAWLFAHIKPRGAPKPDEGQPAPPPVYLSWEDYLAKTTSAERRAWCRKKAKKANAPRLMSGTPLFRVTTDDVWDVLVAARGRCIYCNSLAVEHRPSAPDGRPLPWAAIGRRIGSLGHNVARFHGSDNTLENLSWTCLWCNTWPEERRPGALDHGGLR
jgi:hypothetical protein